MTAIDHVEEVYSGWSTMRLVTFRLGSGAAVKRHVEDHGSAVCVLPYDPARRCALLVSMARAPVLWSGAADILEVPAGCRDSDFGEEVARHEALEEAGVRLTRLERVANAWTMLAVSTERVEFYLAEYAEADRVSAGGGLAEEQEEISVYEISLEKLWGMIARTEPCDMKMAFLLMALRLRRPDLFESSDL